MDNKEMIQDNTAISENMDLKNISNEEKVQKKSESSNKNNGFKTKECKIISYNKKTNTLDVLFENYGIRIKNVKDFNDSIAVIKYRGQIGKPNFEYKL